MNSSDDAYAGRPQRITAYFSDLADEYARHRPSYPSKAVDLLVTDLPQDAIVADVGCGTGIFSRQLASRSVRVIGIEPDASMLARARASAEHNPQWIEYRRAAAEDTGLADASVDLVTCAQAFHWFDAPVTLAEFHRILKPDARLALIWNVPTTDEPFSAGYRKLMERAQAAAAKAGRTLRRNAMRDPSEGGMFEDVVTHRLAHGQSLEHAGLIGRATSASYFPAAGELREQMLGELDALFNSHAKNGRVVLRYCTELVIARRSQRSHAARATH